MKRKGERERYTQPSAEIQRTPRRDRKPFSSEQCKEIGENNTMGKTRDLLKKTGDIKGTFHARMDTIKDRNGTHLIEEKILRRGGTNTQRTVHQSLWSLTEPDTLEREVKGP